MTQYGPNGGANRIKVTGKDLGLIRELINKKPEQIVGDAAEVLKAIGAQAVRDMRETIETSDTPTGLAEGRRGRVRPNDDISLKWRPRVGGKSMRDSVDYKVRINAKSVSLAFGWINGRPGYSLFQDEGTSNGVRGMHALTNAKAHALVELQRMLKAKGIK